ncbi:MAG: protein-(glutamine-N5) methyltransferase, release factor-specific [Gammaproteobacteria bacterium]|nr:MAG: protein-(glutamine-N5) methyltransferase, release factor-specific [Gammaproteobacteria bacterium]PIE38578.1 MAG: protein-(glutamine-N5) methyltransferase, release factor-specific [Gammaproteobacteria bacterium]
MNTVAGVLAAAREQLSRGRAPNGPAATAGAAPAVDAPADDASAATLLDAEVLLATALGRRRSWLRAFAEHAVPDVAERQFDSWWQRRLGGEPLAYILGHREFWSLEFHVNADVLIPRPDTELLVETALAELPALPAGDVLDAGTGSGAIIVAIASELGADNPRRLLACDRSAAALAVAAKNVARHVPGRVTLIQSHWLDAIRDDSLALLVANPPYLAADDPHLDALAPEPREALVAGGDGLDDFRSLIVDAPRKLVADGSIVLEHGMAQGPAVRALLASAGYRDIQTREDLEHRERVTLARQPHS